MPPHRFRRRLVIRRKVFRSFAGRDDVEAGPLQPADERLAKPPVDGFERHLEKAASVAEVENAYTGLARLAMFEHGVLAK